MTTYHLPVVVDTSLAPESDKCILPAEILEPLLKLPELELPHPLIFRLQLESHAVLVGVKQFTSEQVRVPLAVLSRLGAAEGDTVSVTLEGHVPKASRLVLKPLQFHPEITSWKFYLELKLPLYYTTLSKGQVLVVEKYQLVVEDTNAPTVCVVDTEADLEVVPLNDIMARQQLEFDKNLNYLNNIHKITDSVEVALEPLGTALVPQVFAVDLSPAHRSVHIHHSGGDNVDLVAGLDKLVSLDSYTHTSMVDPLVVDVTNDTVANSSKVLYVIPFAWQSAATVNITVSYDLVPAPEPPGTECQNCGASVSPDKLSLHQAYCFRHNKRCSCGEVFQKEVPPTHWKCHCGVHGNSPISQYKHNQLFHNGPYKCTCGDATEYASGIDLAVLHKGTVCPLKLHECRFCHLVVPQEAATFEDNYLNITHHENICGNKTTECYKCNKTIRTKDLANHMHMHLLDKQKMNELVQLSFNKCTNEQCVVVVDQPTNDLGLCDLCYGPLYSSVYDPDHSKLQHRLERRYMLQLSRGCNNVWCTNQYCRTGNPAMPKKTLKEAMNEARALLKYIGRPSLPINKDKPHTTRVWFCVNESIAAKHTLVIQLLAEGDYNAAIVHQAVNKTPSESLARAWLAENGTA